MRAVALNYLSTSSGTDQMLLLSFLVIITYVPAVSLALPNWLGMS